MESEPGKVTTFRVALPATEPGPRAAPARRRRLAVGDERLLSRPIDLGRLAARVDAAAEEERP